MNSNRLAIIGTGASGLVTLKNALEELPDWEIVCFEKGNNTRGCWGNPYPGFVSTSTKYTTQFASFRQWGCRAEPANRASKADFFLGDQYGQYLDAFVNHFGLQRYIRLETRVQCIRKSGKGWSLDIENGGVVRKAIFDKLIICSGLVAKAKPIHTEIALLSNTDTPPKGSTIVVLGGGESGADIAHRLAAPALRNRVFLSLNSGVRVSPRYHPIRGVPSDFLRNRLMLSIHRDIRNTIGQKFVEARIRHQERFEQFFGGRESSKERSANDSAQRKFWDEKLTARAKDQLFNVFHTKSDDFLDDIAEGRITILGQPSDTNYRKFEDFDQGEPIKIAPDYLCPMIGFSSGLEDLSAGEVKVADFHEGCVHVTFDDLFLIGFARPIIGNIPTISEVQAKYVTGVISGKYPRPLDIKTLHASGQERIKRDFPNLNAESIFPVEMFPYCDRLAREMGSDPTLQNVGSIKGWIKAILAPASTTHYVDRDHDSDALSAETVHSPILVIFLLVVIKTIERPLSWLCRNSQKIHVGPII